MRLLLPNKYEWITQVSHWHTQKFCYRGKLGQRSKKRAFINANHIHSITKGMNLKSADELWVTIISIMCQNQLKLCPSLFVTLKISSFQKQRLTALTHVFQRCAYAYLVSPRAWALLHRCGFPQWPSATRPCGGRWHASSVPTSRRRSSHRASGSHPAPSCQTDPESGEEKFPGKLEQNWNTLKVLEFWSENKPSGKE